MFNVTNVTEVTLFRIYNLITSVAQKQLKFLHMQLHMHMHVICAYAFDNTAYNMRFREIPLCHFETILNS